ncbi:MAG: thiamine pyrophosphate-dependent enzyme [Terracidiphilus sp.]|jgi:hypothetical protein
MTSAKKDTAPATEGFSLISNRKLLSLYAAMRACRKGAEETAATHSSNSKRAPSILGHEAAAVGAAIDLLPEDRIATPLLHEAILRTINPQVALVPSLDGLFANHREEKSITVVFANAHTTPLAQWRKILDRAIREKLPILFVSLVAGEKPRPYVPPGIRGYTFPSIAVDGHDVVAVYRVASESIAHARKGHGPTLIESMHVSPGCPLRNMEDYLAAKGLSLDL